MSYIYETISNSQKNLEIGASLNFRKKRIKKNHMHSKIVFRRTPLVLSLITSALMITPLVSTAALPVPLTAGTYILYEDTRFNSDLIGDTINTNSHGEYNILADGYSLTFSAARKNQGIQTYVADFWKSTVNITAKEIYIQDGRVFNWSYENDANGLVFTESNANISSNVTIKNIHTYYDGVSDGDTEGVELRANATALLHGNLTVQDLSANTSVLGVSVERSSHLTVNGNVNINTIKGGVSTVRTDREVSGLHAIGQSSITINGDTSVSNIESSNGNIMIVKAKDSNSKITLNGALNISDIIHRGNATNTNSIKLIYAEENGTIELDELFVTNINGISDKVIQADSNANIHIKKKINILNDNTEFKVHALGSSNIKLEGNLNFTGDILSEANSDVTINLSALEDSSTITSNLMAKSLGSINLVASDKAIFIGSSEINNTDKGEIFIKLENEGKWILTDDSQLNELNIKNAGILEANLKDLTMTGSINNTSGIIDVTAKGDIAKWNNFTINGNYIGNNGATILLDTEINDDLSKTDKLIITGGAKGSTELQVKNAGGTGAQTVNGIHVIQTGSSESNQTFYLDGGAITVGAFDYLLHLKKQETTTDGTFDNWYLESKLTQPTPITPPTPATDIPVYTPDVGEYLAAETMGNTLFTMRLEDREGASQYQNLGDNDTGNVWVRAYGGHHQFKSMQDQLKTKGNSFVTQIGAGLVTLGEEDQYNLGAMTGFAYYDGKTRSNLTNREAKTKINGYSLGLYGTWYAHPVEKRGTYIDSWVLWNKFNNKVDTADQNQYKYDSSGITASIEAGGDYLLNENGKKDWWIQPQAQLIYQGVHADNFKDAQSVDINHGQDNLQARMGVKTYLNIPTDNNKLTSYRPYVALNFIHNTNPYSVEINDIRYENEGSKNLGEFKLGVEGQVTKNSQVWLNASYVAGSHDNQAYQGNIGWKYNF